LLVGVLVAVLGFAHQFRRSYGRLAVGEKQDATRDNQVDPRASNGLQQALSRV